MTDKRRVFIVGGGGAYGDMYRDAGWMVTKNIHEADLVQFTGGEDVSPFLYGEAKHKNTGNNPKRDEEEQKVFNFCLGAGIPMVGICRGGQFLNVMNGGKMWQDVNNHGGSHTAFALGIGPVTVSSTHHQMMRPNTNKEFLVLMNASLSTRKAQMHGTVETVTYVDVNQRGRAGDDVESIYYPDTMTLCYQPHPEFNTCKDTPCRDVFFFFLNNYLLANLDIEQATKLSKSQSKV